MFLTKKKIKPKQNKYYSGVPGGSMVKNSPANAGDTGLIPGLGRYPRKENGNPLQWPWAPLQVT